MNRPAGFWIRVIAYCLDSVLLTVPLIILSFIAGILELEQFLSYMTYFYFFILALYFIFVPVVYQGRTFGKMLCKIEICQVETLEHPTAWNMVKRYIFYYALISVTFGIAYLVDKIMIIVRKDKRSLHDILGGTIVIHSN